jgi:hypothetical protein
MGNMPAMRLALVANRNSGTGTDPRRIAALLGARGADVPAFNVDGEIRELDPARFVTGGRRVRVVVG